MAEHRVVVPMVAGSNPVAHPSRYIAGSTPVKPPLDRKLNARYKWNYHRTVVILLFGNPPLWVSDEITYAPEVGIANVHCEAIRHGEA